VFIPVSLLLCSTSWNLECPVPEFSMKPGHLLCRVFLFACILGTGCRQIRPDDGIAEESVPSEERARGDWECSAIVPMGGTGKTDDGLSDDRLEDRKPRFDAGLIDRRPLAEWQINASAAVLRLDVPKPQPREERDLLILHPSYAAAIQAARDKHSGQTILPSINLVDGKIKQFDDGLYAALDRAYYRGARSRFVSHVDLVRRIFDLEKKDLETKDSENRNLGNKDLQNREFEKKNLQEQNLEDKGVRVRTSHGQKKDDKKAAKPVSVDFEAES